MIIEIVMATQLAHADAAWIQRQYPHCCGIHDCHRLPKNAVSITARGYEFIYEGRLYIASANTEKHTSIDEDYWACIPPSTMQLRCFFPPLTGV